MQPTIQLTSNINTNSTGLLDPRSYSFANLCCYPRYLTKKLTAMLAQLARRPLSNIRLFSALVKGMEKHEVVPDVIPTAPKEVAEVTYPSGVKVDLGNELTPTQVKDIPAVKWNADTSAFYTLCMVDPDAPSRKEHTYREWHHWIVGNIPGCDVSKGETLAEYIGAGPPPDTGLHRYVFLVYKQSGKLKFEEELRTNKSDANRGCQDIKKFASKYNLGEPIAGNLFQALWDDYVPTLYKQLGG